MASPIGWMRKSPSKGGKRGGEKENTRVLYRRLKSGKTKQKDNGGETGFTSNTGNHHLFMRRKMVTTS